MHERRAPRALLYVDAISLHPAAADVCANLAGASILQRGFCTPSHRMRVGGGAPRPLWHRVITGVELGMTRAAFAAARHRYRRKRLETPSGQVLLE
jgi:hypothetical protein